jgi:hypothetical protein
VYPGTHAAIPARRRPTPFPHDTVPTAAKVLDARAVQDLRWTFEGERPRWVRLRWLTGDRLLATAILPL